MMDVVNLIYGLGDEFGMLISSTWGGELHKRILESGEVFPCFYYCYSDCFVLRFKFFKGIGQEKLVKVKVLQYVL